MSFTDGDPAGGSKRTSTLVLVCDPHSIEPRGVSAAESPPHSLHYIITVAAADACIVRPKPLSWGWYTIIFSGVGLFAYFVGGSVFNVKVFLTRVKMLALARIDNLSLLLWCRSSMQKALPILYHSGPTGDSCLDWYLPHEKGLGHLWSPPCIQPCGIHS